MQTAGQQQGVIASDLARQMAAGQQIGGLGSAAQAAALQGAQAQIGAGTLGQQTQQAQDTAVYQQYLQQQGYPFQVAQFLANIAEGTGALSGSTTTSTQPSSFFQASDRRLKHDVKKIGKTKDGLPIYSFKYNGDDRTQIGLMAQDVEKKHPEAVGESGGYKTVDYEKALHPAKKAYGGGLDPNSMGGVVSEPGLFARGGYIAGGAVDPNDISAILAQQRQSFGPFAQHGLYAGSASGMPGGAGGAGVVPQQQMHVPKLITAGAPPKPADSEFSQIYQGYKGLNDITSDMTGKSLTRRGGETFFGKDAVPAQVNQQGAQTAAAQPATPGLVQEGWDKLKGLFSSEQPSGNYRGGLVRHHYDAGGDVEPYDLTNPTKGYVEPSVKEGDDEKTRSLAVAGKGPGAGPSGASELSSALGLGNAAMNFGSGVAGLFDAAPEVMAVLLSTGGVVPRDHFKDGGPEDGDSSGGDAPDYKSMVVEAAKNNGIDPNHALRLVQGESGFTPQSGDENSSGGLWQLHVGGISKTYPHAGLGDEYFAKRQPELASTLTPQEKIAYLNDPQNQKDISDFAANHIAQNGASAWTQARKQGLFGIPASGGGLGGANQRIVSADKTGGFGGDEKTGFFDSNKQYILPILQGLGAMAGSKSRFLGSAILEGLGAGAKAYGDVQQQQALTDAARAQGMSTLSGIGPVIGQFGPTGQPEYRVKVADYGKGSLAPKTPLQQEQERQRKAAEAAVSGKPTTETPISVAQTDRGYNYDVAPTSMSSDALIKAVGSDDKNVTPQLIAANPGLQGQEKLDAELANNRSANAQQASQVRNDLNTMHEAFTGIGPEGFGSKGAGFNERTSLINMWNWAARQAPGIFGEVQPKNLTNAQILDKLRTINVTDFTNKSGSSHAGFIQQAMSNSLPSGAMDENAGIHVMANMYMQNQDGDDFRRFYSNYRNAHGTALNAPTAFDKEMGQRYQMERQKVIHALTPQERPDGTRMSPVDIIRQDPTKAAAFDKRYGMPGLARVFLGG